MRFIRVHVLLGCLLLAFNSFAATVRVQITDELEVFARPDLKSKVIETVSSGQYITMKTDKVVGVGGIGVFYKIKTQTGRIGYVVDADLPTSGDNLAKPIAPPAPEPKPPEPESEPVAEPEPEPPPPPRAVAKPKPMPAPRPQPRSKPAAAASDSAWGVSVGAANFTEKFADEIKSAAQIFFGLRWSGDNGSLLGGRPDAGFVLAPNAPKFLAAAGASGKTSGFILLSDFSLLYDLVADRSYAFFVGGGPLLGYSMYSTNYNGQTLKSSKFKFGGAADVGFALKFSSGLARIDIRYFIESSAYLGGFLTLQMDL